MKKSFKVVVIAILLLLVVGCSSQFLQNESFNEVSTPTAIINSKSSSADIKLVQKKLFGKSTLMWSKGMLKGKCRRR